MTDYNNNIETLKIIASILGKDEQDEYREISQKLDTVLDKLNKLDQKL